MTGVLEVVTFVDAHEQRPELTGTAPLALRPPADDELLPPDVLHLAPVVDAAPRRVRLVEPLRHDALVAALEARLQDGSAAPDEVRRCLPVRAVELEVL